MLQLPNKPHDGGAKDGRVEMSLAVSQSVVGVERMAGSRTARCASLAVARTAGGRPVCPRTSHGDQLVAGGGHQRRLRRLLLLLGPCRTQERIGGHATARFGAGECAVARAAAGGDRRFADQALWAQGGRGRHPSQPHARSGGPEIRVRPYLGHDFAGRAASAVRRLGAAAVEHALRPPTDDGQDSQEAWLEVSHQARAGGEAGGMDRSDRQRGRENAVDRGGRILHEMALLESRIVGRRRSGRPVAQGCGAAICRRLCGRATSIGVAARASTARTKSVWPSEPGTRLAGKESSVRSTASAWPRPPKRSWRPIGPFEA